MNAKPQGILSIGLLLSCLVLTACNEEQQESSAAERAMETLQNQYNELLKDKVDVPVDWASEDLENIGDWEYRVVSLAFNTPQNFEAQLNEFGNDRWQVMWLDKTPDGFLVVMKKPSISYLSRIPLTELGKAVIGGSAAAE